MPRIKTTKEGVVPDVEDAVLPERGGREKLWDEYVANYEKANPVKYAAKRATEYLDEVTGQKRPKADEFATIPRSFLGIVKEQKMTNGSIRRTIA